MLWREHRVIDEYQYEIEGEHATLEFCPWSSDVIAVLYDGIVSILIVEALAESETVVSLADSLLSGGQKASSFSWGNMSEKGIYVGTVDGQLLFFETDEIINGKLDKDADQVSVIEQLLDRIGGLEYMKGGEIIHKFIFAKGPVSSCCELSSSDGAGLL